MISRPIACLIALLVFSFAAQAQSLQDVSESATQWLNAYRAQHGGSQVRVSPRLTKAAAAHARDMAKNGFFSHSGSNGSSVADRVRQQGYGFCFVAENIAKGQRDLQAALSGWANSKGHHRNMVHTSVAEFAVVRGPDNIWVMVLGRPGC